MRALIRSAAGRRSLAIAAALSLLLMGSVGGEAAGIGPAIREAVGVASPAQDAEKTAICHLPGGDAAKASTILVDDADLAEHLDHGDALGQCDDPLPAQQVTPAVQTADLELDGDRVAVCHVPTGNPANARTLHVDPDAAAEHLAHGDTPGACGELAETLVAPDGKVVICHVPAGSPARARTLLVGEDALANHLAHGDAAGECEDPPAATSAAQQQLDRFCERKPDHRRCN